MSLPENLKSVNFTSSLPGTYIKALLHPRTGTYYDKSRNRYVCAAYIDDSLVELGSYSSVLIDQLPTTDRKRAQVMIERKIWRPLIDHAKIEMGYD